MTDWRRRRARVSSTVAMLAAETGHAQHGRRARGHVRTSAMGEIVNFLNHQRGRG